jgi:PD-(D/E)XK endonuclease
VQCKWAARKGAVIVVHTGTCRHTPHGYVRSTYSADEIDGIGVYCQELKRCYYLPIDEFAGRHVAHLRLSPAANNQEVAVRYAAEYEFPGAIAQLGERRYGIPEAGGSSPPSSIFRGSWRLAVLLWPGRLDLEEFEDASLGGGEAVQADAVGGVGEAETREGGEDVAAGRLGGAAFGQQAWQ